MCDAHILYNGKPIEPTPRIKRQQFTFFIEMNGKRYILADNIELEGDIDLVKISEIANCDGFQSGYSFLFGKAAGD